MKLTSKTARKLVEQRKRLVPSRNMFRSAVTNGSEIIPGLDHRSAWARRLRDCLQDQLAALGPPEDVTEFERVLVRRTALLTLQCELIEGEWADSDGKASRISLELYGRASAHLRRIIETLSAGLARPLRDGSRATDVTAHVIDEIRRIGAEP